MRLILLPLFLLPTCAVFSQNENLCHPKHVDLIADSVIQRMDQEDLDDILSSKDFWNSSRYLYFNYSDIEPAIKYAEKKGCKLQEGYAREAINEYIFNRVRKVEECFNEIVETYIEQGCEFSNGKYFDGEYVPKDIDECISQLDKLWDSDLKQKFKTGEIDGFMEYEIGRTLRNGWGLWGHSRLAKYFDNYGLSNPEEISQIILTCYRRHLLGEQIRFDEEVQKSKESEKATRHPLLKEYPREVRGVYHQRTIYPRPKDESDNFGAIHFYTNKAQTFFWVYNYKFGWKRLTPEEYKKTDNNNDIRTWLTTIYDTGHE